jgi:hypothetical protein
METLTFPVLVTMQRNNIRVVSVSMDLLRLRLPSNDGLQSNTSHCSLLKAICPEWPNRVQQSVPSWRVCGRVPAVVVIRLLLLFFSGSVPGSGCSPAVPAAPSSRPVVSSGSLMRCNQFPCTTPVLFVCLFFNARWTDVPMLPVPMLSAPPCSWAVAKPSKMSRSLHLARQS